MRRVVVHIDRLVLKGLGHEDRHAIALGVRERLERVFSDPQALQQLREAGNMPRLRLGALAVGHGPKPGHAGGGAAHEVIKEMQK
jgi:hypothetical protein